MSMISNILSGLHKRGAAALPGEPAIEKKHAPKNRVKEALVGGGVLVLVCAAAWLWWGSRQKSAAPLQVAEAPAKPISAPQAALPPVPSAASAVEVSPAASQPAAEVAQAPQESAPQENFPKESAPPKSSAKEGGHEMAVATLSPEPEQAVPSPSSVRAKPPVAASRQKHRKTSPAPGEEVAPDEESAVAPVPEGRVDKQLKPLTLQQQADNEFRRANGLMQQGHIEEALAGYAAALQLDPGHDAARQAMVVLLLENKRNADAERVLQEGLKRNIKNSGFAMLLARIQLERDASWSALLVLQKTLPYAERQADYRAFVAALLQRLNRHKEAVAHYQAAVQLAPDSGVWWMGLGISLHALQRDEEARAAFKRALESHGLNADLQAFVAQQLKEL